MTETLAAALMGLFSRIHDVFAPRVSPAEKRLPIDPALLPIDLSQIPIEALG